MMDTKLRFSGIYAITNMANGKVYIGGTQNVRKRLSCHRSNLKRGCHHSETLQRDWQISNEQFVFIQIISCSKNDLLLYEQLAIDAYESYDERKGYNKVRFAGSNKGMVLPESAKVKISAAVTKRLSGVSQTAAHIMSLTLARRGKSKLTPVDINMIRADTRPQRVIAKQYGISQAHVCNIRRENLWKESN